MLGRGLRICCAACGQSAISWSRSLTKEVCGRCGLRFERIEGHFIGAVGINTILSFSILVFSLGLSLVLTFPDFPIPSLLAWNAAVAVVVPLVLLPVSRTLWTAIDIAMRPLEPHEVDWNEVYASVGRSLLDEADDDQGDR